MSNGKQYIGTNDLIFEFKPAFKYKEGEFQVLNQDMMDSIGGVL